MVAPDDSSVNFLYITLCIRKQLLHALVSTQQWTSCGTAAHDDVIMSQKLAFTWTGQHAAEKVHSTHNIYAAAAEHEASERCYCP